MSQPKPGLYIHVPFCVSKCRYCGFYSEPVENHQTEKLVSAMITEMRLREIPDCRTIYIGGGSPTCLGNDLLSRLARKAQQLCPEFEEFTIEANPGEVTPQLLAELRHIGVNRISFGVQSFIPSELQFLGRRHSVTEAQAAIKAAENAGFDNISIDLIFAIPGSTLDSWSKNLDHAIDTNVTHISAYALTIEPATPLYHAIEAGEINPPDEELDRQMYEMTIEKFEKANRPQYEISNFALPGYECQHNHIYWENNPYIGIGPAAHSFENRTRSSNISDIDAYLTAIENQSLPTDEMENVTEDDYTCQTAILNLRRTKQGIDIEQFKTQTGQNPLKFFHETIQKHKTTGLLETTPTKIRLTQKALPIADSVLTDFMSFS